MSARGRKSQGSLKNFVSLSNVHCQDESALSPTFSSRCDSQEMSLLSDVFGMDMESETLPSDWRSGMRCEPMIEKTPVSMDCLTTGMTRICELMLDENSQGSDSGLGNELPRRQSTSPKIKLFKERNSLLETKVSQTNSPRKITQKLQCEHDDGFVEAEDRDLHQPGDACGLLCSSMSEKFDWGKDLVSEVRLSPFTLHRRNSVCGSFSGSEKENKILTGRSVMISRTQMKRSSFDSEMDDQSEVSPSVNTTPKRRKSIGSLSLRRALSNVQPIVSRQPPSTPTKRSAEPEDMELKPELTRSVSEIPLPRMDEKKIGKSIDASDNFSLHGDEFSAFLFSKADRHRFELTTLPVDSVASLIERSKVQREKFIFIDCRYPYEYAGGHLHGAINLHTEEMIMDAVFEPALKKSTRDQTCCSFRSTADSIIQERSEPGPVNTGNCLHSPFKCPTNHINQARTLIFYCEFSSRRAPDLARYLRSQDRKKNMMNYPHLFYPDIYIMKGGYHEFHQSYLHLCDPPGYVKMFDKRFSTDLTQHRRKTRKQRWPKGGQKVISPSGHGVSPLRLKEIEENVPHSSPASPPRMLEWS